MDTFFFSVAAATLVVWVAIGVELAVGNRSIRFLWYAIGFPIATLLFIYIMWRSMLAALLSGGVNWRGTRYSLAELKANKV